MSHTRLQIESGDADIVWWYRMNNLEGKGVTDFTDVNKVIEAIYLCGEHPLVRESYLKQVSYNYPDVQAYKDLLKNVKQNLIYI